MSGKLRTSFYSAATCCFVFLVSPAGAENRTWTKYDNIAPGYSDTISTNGRIGQGTGGKGDDNYAMRCTVIKDGATYKMWYTGWNSTNNYCIYYATSSNSLTWIKYSNTVPPGASDTTNWGSGRIPFGTSGRGDSNRTDMPCVIKDGATYKMWYTGHDGTNLRIYYATSPDALTWTKFNNTIPTNSDTDSTDGRIPLGSSGKGDSAGAYAPAVIKDDSTYKMWYTGTPGGSTACIYYATSPDGLTWTKYDNSIPTNSDTTSSNGRIPRGTSGKGDERLALYCSVIKHGIYKMWYSGRTEGDQRDRIYYATSPDGLTWTKINNTIPGTSDTTNWNCGRIPLALTAGRGDDGYVWKPAVINDAATYKMWYTGWGAGAYRIYHATCPQEPPGTIIKLK